VLFLNTAPHSTEQDPQFGIRTCPVQNRAQLARRIFREGGVAAFQAFHIHGHAQEKTSTCLCPASCVCVFVYVCEDQCKSLCQVQHSYRRIVELCEKGVTTKKAVCTPKSQIPLRKSIHIAGLCEGRNYVLSRAAQLESKEPANWKSLSREA